MNRAPKDFDVTAPVAQLHRASASWMYCLVLSETCQELLCVAVESLMFLVVLFEKVHLLVDYPERIGD